MWRRSQHEAGIIQSIRPLISKNYEYFTMNLLLRTQWILSTNYTTTHFSSFLPGLAKIWSGLVRLSPQPQLPSLFEDWAVDTTSNTKSQPQKWRPPVLWGCHFPSWKTSEKMEVRKHFRRWIADSCPSLEWVLCPSRHYLHKSGESHYW